jgi:hypothetical protein
MQSNLNYPAIFHHSSQSGTKDIAGNEKSCLSGTRKYQAKKQRGNCAD